MHRDSFVASTAVMYDFLQVKGGAEAVTLDLCKHFSNMDLITGWVNKTCFESLPIESSRVTELTTSTAIPGWQTIKCAQTFLKSCPDLSRYDSVIYSGSNAPLAILNTKAKNNIYYCHTPPRFVYDLKSYYLETLPIWQVLPLQLLIKWYQPRYEAALRQLDKVFANSVNVQQRLKKYLNVEAEVLYPPVNTNRFKFIEHGNFYLSTARLEPYKRVESIVRAFMAMPDKKLVVTSGGSQELYLRKLASEHSNITFTGWVSEHELSQLVGSCLATIYLPRHEDFGMTPIESNAAGKIVIGVNEGGLKETITHELNGFLLPSDFQVQDVVDLLSKLEKRQLVNMYADALDCSARFNKRAFFERVAQEIY